MITDSCNSISDKVYVIYRETARAELCIMLENTLRILYFIWENFISYANDFLCEPKSCCLLIFSPKRIIIHLNEISLFTPNSLRISVMRCFYRKMKPTSLFLIRDLHTIVEKVHVIKDTSSFITKTKVMFIVENRKIVGFWISVW